MIKKTLCFSNPSYLSMRNKQLVIKIPQIETSTLADDEKKEFETTRPIEDIGIIILDNKQITVTSSLIAALLENNCSIVSCNDSSMPVGLLLPLEGNTIQSERFKNQIEVSLPLKKQMWQQTIQAKVTNQAAVLEVCRGEEFQCMYIWAKDVSSGDSLNIEARAAAFYWKNLFQLIPGLDSFNRGREGDSPNQLLNYGYAILRAIIARSLVGSGLLPTLGIHHRNRYNAYCLADDIMEPYRPFVDELVYGIIKKYGVVNGIPTEIKRELLTIPTLDVIINDKRSPLMVAAGYTTASVARCFCGESRKIEYPKR